MESTYAYFDFGADEFIGDCRWRVGIDMHDLVR